MRLAFKVTPEALKEFPSHKKIIIVEAGSGAMEAGDFGTIRINKVKVEVEKNENGHYRGLHVVIINP